MLWLDSSFLSSAKWHSAVQKDHSLPAPRQKCILAASSSGQLETKLCYHHGHAVCNFFGQKPKSADAELFCKIAFSSTGNYHEIFRNVCSFWSPRLTLPPGDWCPGSPASGSWVFRNTSCGQCGVWRFWRTYYGVSLGSTLLLPHNIRWCIFPYMYVLGEVSVQTFPLFLIRGVCLRLFSDMHFKVVLLIRCLSFHKEECSNPNSADWCAFGVCM